MEAIATASGGAQKLRYTQTLNHSSNSNHRRLPPAKNLIGSTKFVIQTLNHTSTSKIRRPFTIQASNNPQIRDRESASHDNAAAASNFQVAKRTTDIYKEDLNYLWRLVVGSHVGAAVIKYRSILVPEITRPKILQALVMISTPVVVAVWLLIKQRH